MLSRESFLGAKLKTVTVDVPELGGAVSLLEMSGTAREAWETCLSELGDKAKCTRAILLAHCIVDENGSLMFSKKDIDSLSTVGASVLERLCRVAVQMNSLGEDAAEESRKN